MSEKQEKAGAFGGLRAVYLNCTLKRADEPSHTELLMNASADIMRKNGVAVEMIRPGERQIAFGV